MTPAVPSLHGTVSPFNGSHVDWIEYAERLDNYFVAHDIVDVAKKRAILLNAVGPTTYHVINAPINVMPHYTPPGHYRGQGGDLTN